MGLNHHLAAAHALRRHFPPTELLSLFLSIAFVLLPLRSMAQGDAPLSILVDFSDGPFALKVRKLDATSEAPGRIDIAVPGKLSQQPEIQILAEPSRLVVDLPGFSLKSGRVFNLTDSLPLLKLRLGSHKDKVRMVLDFAAEGMPPYQVLSASDPFHLVVDLLPGQMAAEMKKEETAGETIRKSEEAGKTRNVVAATRGKEGVTVVPAPVVKAVSPVRRVKTEAAPMPVGADVDVSPVLELPLDTALAPEDAAEEDSAKEDKVEEEKKSDSSREGVSAQELLKFSVDKVYVSFEPGSRPIQNLVARSRYDKSIYITAGAQRVFNPGTVQQTIEPTEELLVSPRRFELEAQGERTLRLVLKKPATEEEAVYRIVLLPQADSFERQLMDVRMKGELRRMDVITGLVINVVSRPARPTLDIAWKVENGQLVVTNSGNTEVFLESGQFCPEEQEQCFPVPSKRLYAGNSFGLKVPEPGVFRFMKRHGEEFSQLVMTVK